MNRLTKKYSFPCNMKYLKNAKKALDEFLADIKRENKDINIDVTLNFYLQLVIDEAVVNAIDHGSACKSNENFDLEFVFEDGKLIMYIVDYGGKPFNPEFFQKLALKKTWGIGGRGIQIISNLMDEVTYLFNKGKSTTLIIQYDFFKERENEE